MNYDVFISHARADYKDERQKVIPGNAISRIKDAFDRAGITYWIDEHGIGPGDHFPPVLAKNIRNSRIFLFVSSERSNKSYWAGTEVAVAHEYGKKIIPFRLDRTIYDEQVIMYLLTLDAIDYFANPKAALTKLVKAVGDSIGEGNDDSPSVKVYFSVDTDCTLYLFDKPVERISAGKDTCVMLHKGANKLKFISLEDERDVYEELMNLGEDRTVKYVKVKLLPIIKKRKIKDKVGECSDRMIGTVNDCRERWRQNAEERKQKTRMIVKWLSVAILAVTVLLLSGYVAVRWNKIRLREGEQAALLAKDYYEANDVLNSERYYKMAKKAGYNKMAELADIHDWVDSIKRAGFDELALRCQSEMDVNNARKYALVAREFGYSGMDAILEWVKDETDSIGVFDGGVLRLGWIEYPMIVVDSCTFMMGVNDSDEAYKESQWDDAKPQHIVSLDGYMIGKFEVSRDLWNYVMNDGNCIPDKDGNLPVGDVSWNDCQEFILRLNNMVGANFRLPSEAEWECAAKGGGSSKNYDYSSLEVLDRFAVTKYNGKEPQAVDCKTGNELGIHNMLGNVSEWCMDVYADYPDSRNDSLAFSYVAGPKVQYVARGGSFAGKDACHVSFRQHSYPDRRIFGLRLAMDME